MMNENIGNMSLEQLEQFIEQVIERKSAQAVIKPSRKRSVQEVLESLDRNRWTPPSGSPSNSELLRESRDA